MQVKGRIREAENCGRVIYLLLTCAGLEKGVSSCHRQPEILAFLNIRWFLYIIADTELARAVLLAIIAQVTSEQHVSVPGESVV
jgi:hypothetical protein